MAGSLAYYLRRISFLKTIRFNFHYFKIGIARKLPIIIGKNVANMNLCGQVNLNVCNKEIQTGLVKIGFCNLGIVDEKRERMIFDNSGSITFKGKADIGTGSRLSNAGDLVFGEGFQSSGKMTIICNKRISFGNDCLISWNTLFMDSDLHDIIDSLGGYAMCLTLLKLAVMFG